MADSKPVKKSTFKPRIPETVKQGIGNGKVFGVTSDYKECTRNHILCVAADTHSQKPSAEVQEGKKMK